MSKRCPIFVYLGKSSIGHKLVIVILKKIRKLGAETYCSLPTRFNNLSMSGGYIGDDDLGK